MAYDRHAKNERIPKIILSGENKEDIGNYNSSALERIRSLEEKVEKEEAEKGRVSRQTAVSLKGDTYRFSLSSLLLEKGYLEYDSVKTNILKNASPKTGYALIDPAYFNENSLKRIYLELLSESRRSIEEKKKSAYTKRP